MRKGGARRALCAHSTNPGAQTALQAHGGGEGSTKTLFKQSAPASTVKLIYLLQRLAHLGLPSEPITALALGGREWEVPAGLRGLLGAPHKPDPTSCSE